jgi:hypothetical protein
MTDATVKQVFLKMFENGSELLNDSTIKIDKMAIERIIKNTLNSEFLNTSAIFPVKTLQYKTKLIDARRINDIHIHSAAGIPNAPTLAVLVENPPVATDENACARASIHPSPTYFKRRV